MPKRPIIEVPPLGFLAEAATYCEAANRLYDSLAAAPMGSAPIYWLYCHATEMALKAFLRQRGISTAALRQVGHNLEKLHAQCIAHKLDPDPAFAMELSGVIGLLGSANSDQAFRYREPRSGVALPSIEWPRSAVPRLHDLVRSRIPPPSAEQLRIAGIRLVMGRPE